MRQTFNVFSIGMRVVMRDAVMLVLIPAPFLVGITFRLIFPWLNHWLITRINFSIVSFYPLLDSLMILLTPTLLTMSSAFLLLEECDEGIGGYYQITPARQLPYLTARIGLPALWGFLCSILVTVLFGLSGFSLQIIAASAFVAVLFGCGIAMMIVSLAANRVEGLALSKLTGITMVGLIIAWFIPDSWRWFASILPSFWLGELALGKTLGFNLFMGILSGLLWIALFTKKFQHKIS